LRDADQLVVAGLVPAIHVFVAAAKQDVDARQSAGRDGGGGAIGQNHAP
jgi:hypothetical protein